MKRSLYYLHDEQHDWLREQAHRHNVTASALVRTAIEHMRENVVEGGDWLQSLLTKHEGTGS